MNNDILANADIEFDKNNDGISGKANMGILVQSIIKTFRS